MDNEQAQVGIFVLGMHRSGTSALTRVLSLLGCALPRTLMIEGPGNREGHWECEPISWFDDRLLESLGSKWNDWLPIDSGWYGTVYYRRDVDLAAALLRAEFGTSSPFVLKDPRMCRLLPLWIEAAAAAEMKPLFVLPIRNPVEVAKSLRARDGIDEQYSHLVWLSHVLAAEHATRSAQRCFVGFDELFDDWQKLAAQLETCLDLQWPRDIAQAAADVDEFLKVEHRHHRHRLAETLADQSLNPWLRGTYEILARWSQAGENPEDYAALDKFAEAFEAAAPAFSDLIASGQRANERMAELEAHAGTLAENGHPSGPGDDELKLLRENAGEVDALAEAKTAIEARAAALVDENARLEQRTAELSAEVARLEVLAVAADGQIAVEREQVARAVEERRLAEDRIQAAEAEASALTAQTAMLSNQLAELGSHLSQRQEEVAQAYTQLAQSRSKAEAALAAGEAALAAAQSALAAAEEREIALTGRLADSEAWVFNLASERAKTEAAARRTMAQHLANAARTKNETAALHRKVEVLEAQLAFASEALQSAKAPITDAAAGADDAERTEIMKNRIETLSGLLTQQERAVIKLDGEKRVVEQRMADAHAAASDEATRMTHMSSQIEGLRHQLAEQERAVLKADVETRAVQRLLDARSAEISRLTLSAQKNGHEVILESERAEWLREVNAALLTLPRWRALMPAAWQARRTHDLLKRRGLFDAERYRADYPDVAAAGMDPLYHYINHGMRENRQPGIAPATLHSNAASIPASRLPEPPPVPQDIDPEPVGNLASQQVDMFVPVPVNYGDKRIIVIDGTYPTPDRDSGSVDMVNFIKIFKDLGYAVYFIATANFRYAELDAVAAAAYRNLGKAGVEVLDDRNGPSVSEVIRMNGGYFETFFLSRVYAGGIFFEDIRTHAPDSRIIFNTVDVHWLRELREGELEGDRMKVIGAYRTAEREHYLARLADATIVVSANELKMLTETVPGACVYEIPLVRDIPGTTVEPKSRHSVGFIGGYKHSPNIDAVNYFLDEIWPLIRREIPDLQFYIMGADMPETLREREGPGVVIVGKVDNLQQAFDSLRLSVAPLRAGAGAKGKVISSLSHGLPCVATAIAAEGMGLDTGIAIAQSASDFAREVVRLCRDDDAWQQLSDRGLKLMAERHSLSSGKRIISQILESIK